MQPTKTIIFCLCAFAVANAGIINVPADQATIQAGIDAAVSGDTVLVAEGEYKESIYFMAKNITVASHFIVDQDTTHISKTIIKGMEEQDAAHGSIVHFVNGETNESVLMGFTLSDGIGSSIGTGKRGGGAILIDKASPRICYNIIKNNTVQNSGTSYAAGGGICVTMSSHEEFTIIDHNRIELNKISSSKSSAYGGGVFVGAHAKIHNNKISNNEVVCTSSTLISVATGGGLCCKQISELINVVIDSNIIERNYVHSTNRASYCGGVDLLVTNTEFTNNIVRENIINGKARNNLPGMRVINRSDSLLIEHNLFQGNRSEGDAFCSGSGLGLVSLTGGTVQYNTFNGNMADEGAGLFLAATSVKSIK